MTDASQQKQSLQGVGDQLFRSVCESIQAKFADLLDSMPDGIVITDTSGRIVFASSQAETLFGYERGELVSLMIESLVPVSLREEHVGLRNSYYAAPRSRPLGQGQVLFGVRRDGAEVPVGISLSPMQTEDGLLVCAAVRDVSDRLNTEQALRASEEQVRLLLDSTAEAIYGLDLEGKCTFCNWACVVTLGYHHTDELLGRNMHDLIHHTRNDGSHYPMQECRIYEAFRHGEGTHVDDEIFWKANGSSFPAEYRSFPVRRDGELVGSVVTFLDITEQKRIAEAFRTQQAELAHAGRLSTLGEMAAGLAHELNQPLTAMSAFAEGALERIDRGTLLNTDVKTIFSRIAEDAQRAGEIIRRLRNFVQKRQAQREELDVNHMIRDVFKFIETDAKEQNIIVQFELSYGLPKVEADSIEFQQVLLNLIRNASDALQRTEINERKIIITSYLKNPEYVEIAVKDSGPGISDSEAKQLFEPFYTSKADGLGIGLGICKNIIESHGGKIWLEQSQPAGLSVHFQLPAAHQYGGKTDEK
jgi:PAS domain S-box-containing protein